MMKKMLIIIASCLFCIACGVKSDPEYKAQVKHIKIIKIV